MVKEECVKFVVYLTIVLNYSFVIYSLYQGGGTVTIGIVIIGTLTTLLLVGVKNSTCLKCYLILNPIYLVFVTAVWLVASMRSTHESISLQITIIIVLLISWLFHYCAYLHYKILERKNDTPNNTARSDDECLDYLVQNQLEKESPLASPD